ncbi:MAG: UDP-N-acetylglucosamine--N-acetylmuramyl-(pentapeptide) pyrophosphoryl-undecaprenol N-acetylglucosamine transferase [Planctomycetes bacterium]|nr:UDP-N-acetylglucosamine--N-acetylmuramyl-(pentapeptide) pyrophosphoryl-undecaprenol N-acetylglucosamine transferase [Planctomycetota bacterium]
MRILFAGGGTGGHLFPGIALAQQARNERPDVRILFLCTERPFDRRELAAYGFDHEPIPAPRLKPRFSFPRDIWRAVAAGRGRVRSFRPDLVVGLGGYGSFPTLMAARLEGIPYVLLEQNVLPGRANRVAAWGARRVYAQWEESRRHFAGLGSRFVASGSPLRLDLEGTGREEARRRLGIGPEMPLVGVIGGSQGAESLNRAVVRELSSVRGIQIFHLAGPSAGWVREAYAAAGREARVEEFRRDMGAVYGACDAVISRAGALALAELAAAGCPSILVPYPHAVSDHQAVNAAVLARAGAAVVVPEREARPGDLAGWVQKLVRRDALWDKMRRNISAFARPDAARHILKDFALWLPTLRRAWPTWSASAASA